MPVTLHQVHNMPSLVRSYKWDLSFPNPPSLLTSAVAGFSSNFNIRAISTSVPKARMEDVTAAPRGIDLHEPGLVHLDGQVNFTLVDTVDLVSRRILYRLRQICMTDIDKIQQDLNQVAATSNSSRSGNTATIDKVYQNTTKPQGLTILMTRLDNKNRPIWHYLAMKCFLADYTDPDFDGQSSAVTPGMTIQYNYFLDGAPGTGTDNLTAKLSGTGLTIQQYTGY